MEELRKQSDIKTRQKKADLQKRKRELEPEDPEKLKEDQKKRKIKQRIRDKFRADAGIPRKDPEKQKEDQKKWKIDQRTRDKSRADEGNPRLDTEKVRKDYARWQQKHRVCETAEARLRAFLETTLFGSIFLCLSCQTWQFQTNVQEYSNNLKIVIAEKISREKWLEDANPRENLNMGMPSSPKLKIKPDVLCNTCVNYLKKGKTSPSNVKNGLKLDETDKQIEDQNLNLTELENALIAKTILFQKIFLLPKSRWTATLDKQVNIPIPDNKINETLDLLPRTPNNAGLIGVELKRKLEYKGNHKHQMIDPKKLISFVDKAKWCGNKYYQDVHTFESYQTRCKQADLEGFNLVFGEDKAGDEDMLKEDDLKDEFLEEPEDLVKKFQFRYDDSVLMTDKYPEISVSVAPGEDQRPLNILMDKDWDIKAFPSLHNISGFNGKDQERDVKLTDQRYFIQRITNMNSRFSKCPSYLYAAVGYLEQMQINRNINLVGTRGKKSVSALNLLCVQSVH